MDADKLDLDVLKLKYMYFQTANKHVSYFKLSIIENNIELVTIFIFVSHKVTITSTFLWIWLIN